MEENKLLRGALYVVGTPIGNLSDFSPRAAETLAAVDFIAAEDTRVTMKLLNHFGIKKPLVSYYEHNKEFSGKKILERILAGENCAQVSDAGSPAISDPGEDLVRLCGENGVAVEGVDPGTLLIGEPLQTKDGDAELVEYLAEVLYQLEGRGLYTQVDSIDFSDKNHVSFSYGDKYMVKLGGPGKTEYKFGMLVSVMSQLLAGDVGVIDVSDGMTARFRPE